MKRHHLPLFLIPLLLVPFGAIADNERMAYTCDNDSHIDISFFDDSSGRPQASLHFADETIILPQVPSASGPLYRKGDIRLHTRGDDAIFEDGKNNLRRCTHGHAPPAASRPAPPVAAAASSFVELSGRVSYRSRLPLPPGAILSIRILAGGLTLVDQRYELDAAQPPIPFTATVDRDLIGPKTRLAVTARIDAGGKTRFISDKVYPVIKDKQPQPVDIALKSASHATAR